MPDLASPRLRYRPVSVADLDAFHALLTDEHVRRYLLDGHVVSLPVAADEIAASERLFAAHGIGLWLASDATGFVGFCGARVFESIDPHPHLLYALLPRATGHGLATEMLTALVDYCTAIGFTPLRAGVDEINGASVRVLEKCGFTVRTSMPGAFGAMRIYERVR